MKARWQDRGELPSICVPKTIEETDRDHLIPGLPAGLSIIPLHLMVLSPSSCAEF